MRVACALALMVATCGLQGARATERPAGNGEIVVEALPDIEVRLPADRTEFSLPLLPVPDDAQRQIESVQPQAMPTPAAPPVAVAPPPVADAPAIAVTASPVVEPPAIAAAPRQPSTPDLSGLAAPELPEVVVTIPENARSLARVEPPVAALVAPGSPARPVEPVRRVEPKPQIAIAPPVVSPPVMTPAAPAQPPVAVVPAQDWKPRLARAVDQIATLGPLPPNAVQSLRSFYEARSFEPVFTQGKGLSARGKSVTATIARANEHGLDQRRFQRLMDAARGSDTDVAEVAIAAAAIAYARDARGARINPQSVSRLITARPTLPETEDVLTKLSLVPDASAALESWNPQHAGYRALRARLAQLRGTEDQTASVPQRLTHGPVLWIGMSDPRVPLLREVLGLPAADDLVFDASLANAVRKVQRDQGMRATGRLDKRVVAALGGVDEAPAHGSASMTSEIIANMERWRWLPVDLGDTYVFVNIPGYGLEMKTRAGRTVFETRVVVGKPETPTPVFSHRMEYLVVNPTWTVPPSIANKEYLPLLKSNPYALQARGLQIISRGKVVDPGSVDWSQMGRSVAIRQPPGERNALGHVKFMFPNEHAVYLHDTPSRGLFSAARRAFSHGCVRVQNPFALASAVMGWNEGRLRGMVGGGERRVDLPADVDVHLAYFTLEANADGSLARHEDIYGHNRRTRALLGI